MKVVLASQNKHKWEEIRKITEKLDIQLIMESDLGMCIEVEETGTTFEENSFQKAEAVMKATGLPALADDSGISVEALNGAPGVYSARYGTPDLDDHGRMELLRRNMENVPDGQRQAKYVCVITMVTPEGETIQARGEAMDLTSCLDGLPLRGHHGNDTYIFCLTLAVRNILHVLS